MASDCPGGKVLIALTHTILQPFWLKWWTLASNIPCLLQMFQVTVVSTSACTASIPSPQSSVGDSGLQEESCRQVKTWPKSPWCRSATGQQCYCGNRINRDQLDHHMWSSARAVTALQVALDGAAGCSCPQCVLTRFWQDVFCCLKELQRLPQWFFRWFQHSGNMHILYAMTPLLPLFKHRKPSPNRRIEPFWPLDFHGFSIGFSIGFSVGFPWEVDQFYLVKSPRSRGIFPTLPLLHLKGQRVHRCARNRGNSSCESYGNQNKSCWALLSAFLMWDILILYIYIYIYLFVYSFALYMYFAYIFFFWGVLHQAEFMAGPRLPGAQFFDLDGVATPHSTPASVCWWNNRGRIYVCKNMYMWLYVYNIYIYTIYTVYIYILFVYTF